MGKINTGAISNDWVIFSLFTSAGILFAGWYVFRMELDKRLLKLYFSGAGDEPKRPKAPGYWEILAARASLKLDSSLITLIIIGACTGGYFIGLIITGNPLISILFISVGPLLFWQYLTAKADSTDWVVYKQTGDFCKMMANAVGAGQSPEMGFVKAVPKLPEPLAGLLEEPARRVGKGEPLVDVLKDAQRSVTVTPFRLFIVVTRVWKKRGGNLASAYMGIYDVVTKSTNAAEKIKTVNVSGIRRGLIITAGPVLAVVLGRIGAPDYMAPLFNTTSGLVLFSVAVGLIVGAWLMIRKITTLKLM